MKELVSGQWYTMRMKDPFLQRGKKMAYAYHVPFDKSHLSLGISVSFRQNIFDQSVFKPVVTQDPIIDYSRESVFIFNSDIGVLYYRPDFYVGAAALNLFPMERKTYWQDISDRQYWFQAGYIFDEL
ncbi:MAG TPA: type IX secretion system membrane protein PorP/SprF, partial [Bacteroidales bacterium]|nr:type IX secretion system membrane protein PorP/SprF [Bacteroidales bacterium]